MKKFLDRRKIILLSTIAILVFTSIILSGCTQKIRYPIEHLSFSYDGTKLVSVTYPNAGYYETDLGKSSGLDIQVWDVLSNEITWKESYPENFYCDTYDEIYLSLDGKDGRALWLL
ncbi:MAG: hypothetical protein DRN27_10265 [Thermoplasmata archaeon]|nr:MAG: hypothetical protein DRN27_10265 [Thermoplasmata archaeon]